MLDQDHTGLPFNLDYIPKRIVCLVPSITELLYDLGLADQVCGRTKFCIFPNQGFPNAKIIGGTKNVHVDKVLDLKPDLVIANKEENVKDQVMALAEATNVFTTIVRNSKEALDMISDIGKITGKADEAQSMIQQFTREKSEFKDRRTLSMVYLIWQEPYMTVGGDTFISAFMEDFGFINCFKESNRYPEVSISDIREKNPDVVLLSSEPFPFAEKHQKEINEISGIKTLLIDGSICSWYGSRMLKAQDFFKTFKQQIEA